MERFGVPVFVERLVRVLSSTVNREWRRGFAALRKKETGGDVEYQLSPNHKLLFVVDAAWAYREEERWADGGFEGKLTGRMPTKCRPARGGW